VNKTILKIFLQPTNLRILKPGRFCCRINPSHKTRSFTDNSKQVNKGFFYLVVPQIFDKMDAGAGIVDK